jgi:hypothetical protein
MRVYTVFYAHKKRHRTAGMVEKKEEEEEEATVYRYEKRDTKEPSE